MRIAEVPLLVLCFSSVLFYCYGIYAACVFNKRWQGSNDNFIPAITILKPICGSDSETYINLASFCQQNYPDSKNPNYEIIFAVRDPLDSAVGVIKQIINDFPQLDIQLIVNECVIGTNLKVSNLANAFAKARHDILLLADSDIRVGEDYLQRVIQPLQDENVGVVTCLYRSLAEGWVTNLEAIGTACDFHAGVLVSNQLEGRIKYAFGSTILIRKKVLENIGGFEAIADYLADDFQLGSLPAQAGYKVVLSDYIVEHVLSSDTLANAIKQQTRWARCVRVSRPWGYFGLIFTYGVVSSLLLLIFSRASIFAWEILCITWMIRLLMAWVIGVQILKDLAAQKYLLLVPLRDIITFVVWCHGFFGNIIDWRGQRMLLTKEGKLVAITNEK
jgi:ceramide glucosyltransferase